MGDESDFTFCKVSPDGNDDVLPESPRVILEVGSLSVEGAHVKRDGKTEKGGESSARSSQPEESGEKSGGASLVKSRAVPQTSTRKPVARAKVPYEKGFSQMDWMKLTRTHPDLAGLNGKSNRRMISLDEVRQHKTDGSIWTVLKGRVYNITPYMKFHPGGPDMLMKAAGKDCTSLFNKYHAWVNSEFLLEKCLVGVLGDSS